MSDPLLHTGRMKLNRLTWFPTNETELIARFGDARLVRHLDGRHELIGGTLDDLAAAREWCSLFAHDLVFSAISRSLPRRSFAA